MDQRADVRYVTNNYFFRSHIDGLPNCLRYGAPLAHVRRVGARP